MAGPVVPNETLTSLTLYLAGGVVLLVALIVVVRRSRSRRAPQSPAMSFHDAMEDFERRVLHEAEALGKVRPDSGPVIEVGTPVPAETREVVSPGAPEQAISPDGNADARSVSRPVAIEDVARVEATGPTYFVIGPVGSSKTYRNGLKKGETVIGRSKDADIVLIDIAVSRRHARVRYENGQFVYVDLEPTNPSFINGKIYDKPLLIKHGDEIVIGKTRLVFKQPVWYKADSFTG